MRDLLKRTLGAAGLVVVLGVGIMINRYLYAALFSAVILLSTHEYYHLTVGKRYSKEKFAISAAEVMFFLGAVAVCSGWLAPRWLMASAIPFILALIFMLFDCCEDYDLNTHAFFPVLYVALPLTSTTLIAFDAEGNYHNALLIAIFALTWFSDAGAYGFGMAFGQKPNSKKLFPSLSPKKSWAGVIGGALAIFLSAFGFWALYNAIGCQVLTLLQWMIMALIIAVIGIFGDLFESLIKRHCQVKDVSHIIPGHGGILDRFDDLFFVFPSVAVYLSLINVI